MSMPLNQQVVVVTGASCGRGRVVVGDLHGGGGVRPVGRNRSVTGRNLIVDGGLVFG